MPRSKDPNYAQPSRALVLEREERAWEMRVGGSTLKEIALDLGISIEGARKILDRVEARERDRFEAKRDQIRSRQFAQQERLIGVAFKALGKSLEPRTQITEKTADDGSIQKIMQVVEQAADIKYAYFILKAQSDQRDLCGLNVQPEENPRKTVTDLVREMAERAANHECDEAIYQAEGQNGAKETTDQSPARNSGDAIVP